MLICAFKEQLALFPTLDSFEIDMSYKRVKDPISVRLYLLCFMSNKARVSTSQLPPRYLAYTYFLSYDTLPCFYFCPK